MDFAFRRDLALGHYVDLDTPLHRLDPRTKMLLFGGVLLALFRIGLPGVVLVNLALVAASQVAGFPLRTLISAVRAMRWILLITFLYQVAWAGPTRLGGVEAGAVAGLHMVLRLTGMVMAASLLTHTTEPVRLADGLARLFRFLEPLRVPVRDLAMVLTLALRFLPTVMEEAQRIVTAQRARGARFDGGPLARARQLLPLAVPLFAGCLHRADTLAMAMEARGFKGAARRTQMDPPAFSAADALALAGLAAGVLWILLWPGA
ncbi:MAG: energy-coupling factor transporter transmembrane component T family protein [Planctomycetota bacterium]